VDPVKYDFALFGLGIEGWMKEWALFNGVVILNEWRIPMSKARGIGRSAT
jgi:hypothetical protein